MNIKDTKLSGGCHVVILGAGASIASTIRTYSSFCRLRYARSPDKDRGYGHFNFLRGKIKAFPLRQPSPLRFFLGGDVFVTRYSDGTTRKVPREIDKRFLLFPMISSSAFAEVPC